MEEGVMGHVMIELAIVAVAPREYVNPFGSERWRLSTIAARIEETGPVAIEGKTNDQNWYRNTSATASMP
jgi:hypothetical protein